MAFSTVGPACFHESLVSISGANIPPKVEAAVYVSHSDLDRFLQLFIRQGREQAGKDLIAAAQLLIRVAEGRERFPLGPATEGEWAAYMASFSAVAEGVDVVDILTYSLAREQEREVELEGSNSLSWWVVRRLPMGAHDDPRPPTLGDLQTGLLALPKMSGRPFWPHVVQYTLLDLFEAAVTCAWLGEPDYRLYLDLLRQQCERPLLAFNYETCTLHVLIA